MAEVLAKHAAKRLRLDAVIASAGVAAHEGDAASGGARRAMEARGLSLEAHRARMLASDLAGEAELILTMTGAHARAVKRIAPDAKVFALREYLDESGDVADPWGGSDADYEACARELEALVSRAVERMAGAK